MFGRLGGWQRIGVVLTALWLLFVFGAALVSYSNIETGGGVFVETIPGGTEVVTKGRPSHCTQKASEQDEKGDPVTHEIAYEVVAFDCAPGHLVDSGSPDVTRQLPDQHRFLFGAMCLAAFIPPVIVWLLILGLVVIIRWISNGFRHKQQ